MMKKGDTVRFSRSGDPSVSKDTLGTVTAGPSKFGPDENVVTIRCVGADGRPVICTTRVGPPDNLMGWELV